MAWEKRNNSHKFHCYSVSHRDFIFCLHISVFQLFHITHLNHKDRGRVEAGDGGWGQLGSGSGGLRNSRPSSNIPVSHHKHLTSLKRCSSMWTKSWSPDVSTLTRPIWKQEGKYKPAFACHFISWLVRACFLCISLNMAFHRRDFAVLPPPLRYHRSTFDSQLQTIYIQDTLSNSFQISPW